MNDCLQDKNIIGIWIWVLVDLFKVIIWACIAYYDSTIESSISLISEVTLLLCCQLHRVDLLVLKQISIMILAALLTSVGINLGLCSLFFTLYSLLRKQPCNLTVYAPRLVSERKRQEGAQSNLERLLASTDWVREAWETTEEEFLSTAGLDAFVFMRIFVFRWLKLFHC